MDTRPTRAPDEPQRAGKVPRGIMQRLVDGLRRRPVARGGSSRDLPPPGQRSGSGADSLEPYLEHTRNTRPSPLE